MCIYTDCKIRSLYNFEGISAKYCSLHKKEGMVDVNSKRCIYEGCNKYPTFTIFSFLCIEQYIAFLLPSKL